MKNYSSMSDKELYALAKRFGEEALAARRKFGGLLPEVARRRLYEKKGYSCLYEFAAKLAGMSRDQVDTVFRLERKFEDKPALHAALIEGKISANKLVRIASIATTENQEELFQATRTLSKQAIDVFVKDYKSAQTPELQNQNGLLEPLNEPKFLPGQTMTQPNNDFVIINALSPEVKEKMKELMDNGININELLLQFFQQREQNITKEKEALSRQEKQKEQEKAMIGYPTSRHVPAKVELVIKAEYGTRCSEPGCNKPAAHIHHESLFSKYHSHDPMYLKPLCRGHHELRHAGQAKFDRCRLH